MTVASGPSGNADAAVPEDTASDLEVSAMASTVLPYPVIGQMGDRPVDEAEAPGGSTMARDPIRMTLESRQLHSTNTRSTQARTPSRVNNPMVPSDSYISRLNDRHVGTTVFVVGAGPQLAAVSTDQLRQLEAQPVIAVNKVFYRLRPRYFLSAYIGELMLALRRIPEATLLHMRPEYTAPLLPGITALRRMIFNPGDALPRLLDEQQPTLLTRLNVALGATHLAYIMGAKRIVYLGVEQRNQLHFWHFDEKCRQEIRDDIVSRGDPDTLRIDHEYASLSHELEALDRPAADCMKPFYSVDHTPTFAAYFDILRDNGVDVVATTAESVVADAGARVMALDDVLAT